MIINSNIIFSFLILLLSNAARLRELTLERAEWKRERNSESLGGTWQNERESKGTKEGNDLERERIWENGKVGLLILNPLLRLVELEGME